MGGEQDQSSLPSGFVETEDLARVVLELKAARREWRGKHGRGQEMGGRELPSRKELGWVVESICAALFPMRLGPPDLRTESEDFFVGHTLDLALGEMVHQARLELTYAANKGAEPGGNLESRADLIVRDFAESLPEIRRTLDSDIEAAYQGDPAARSVDEVLLCYPGIRAVIYHRLAHRLFFGGCASFGPGHRGYRPFGHGNRHPPRSEDWAGLFYRPRNRSGHRRDDGYRGKGEALPGRDPGGQAFSGKGIGGIGEGPAPPPGGRG